MNSMKRDGLWVVLFFSLYTSFAFGQVETVNASYTLPDSAFAGIPFEVGLKLNRGNIEGIARIQQEFPLGFSINEIENAGAIFSMSKSQLQFLWIALPKQNEFEIRFEVTANKEYSGAIEIPTKFIYLENNVRKELELPLLKMTIQSKGSRSFEKIKTPVLPQQTNAQTNAHQSNTIKINEISKPAKSININSQENTEKGKAIPEKVEASKNPVSSSKSIKTDSIAQTKNQLKKTEPSNTPARMENTSNNKLKVEEKKNDKINSNPSNISVISFKIQLAALPQKSDIAAIAKEFEINEKDITEEKHNGLFKYTFGVFKSLTDARKTLNENNQMKSKSFVAGYRNGLRIDLEEAIRLSKIK